MALLLFGLVGESSTHLIPSPIMASYLPNFLFGARSVWFSFFRSGFSSLCSSGKESFMSLGIDVTVTRRLMFTLACY
jgi:hypothetical protein